MQCGIVIHFDENTHSLLHMKESLEVAKASYGRCVAMKCYPVDYSDATMFPDCGAVVFVRAPLTRSIIDNYIDPSISKLKNFNLSRVISVDINLVENSKFEIVSLDKRKSKPMGVTIYNEEK